MTTLTQAEIDGQVFYDEAAAKLSWERTVAFFKKHLA
jgi:hypothetical protein